MNVLLSLKIFDSSQLLVRINVVGERERLQNLTRAE